MSYLNPGGHNWGAENLDGYGISQITFAVVYSIAFHVACLYVWTLRKHPIIKMRKIGLAIISLQILHVYMFMVFMVYPLNGAFPCSVEYWVMSLYLPIGFGLFQAANQQLCLVSQGQIKLTLSGDTPSYKPMPTGRGPKKLVSRFKLWWADVSSQGRYEGFVAVGIALQFTVSLIIYCISRKWNSYGIVSHHTTPGMCRKGWEWFPSILWQFLWNYVFGPVLLWKMRSIHDSYHWRLQTSLCIVAGLVGSPLWLAAVQSDKFVSVNKYWVPAMWFVPGMMTMQILTLGFPICEVYKYMLYRRKTDVALTYWDPVKDHDAGERGASITSTTTNSSHRMWAMSSLTKALNTNPAPLQVYASCVELNGENIIFLTKVAAFEAVSASQTSSAGTNPDLHDHLMQKQTLFRAALSIYISLVYVETAAYPINIESQIYATLEKLFGPAANLVAARSPTSPTTPPSNVTPWDEPVMPTPSQNLFARASPALENETGGEAYPMAEMGISRTSISGHSARPIVHTELADPLSDYLIPDEFDGSCFDAAAKSIRFMVWTETWQRFCNWQIASGHGNLGFVNV